MQGRPIASGFVCATTIAKVDPPRVPLFSLKSHRLRICLFLTIALYIGYANRMALSVGVVCMVNSTSTNGDDSPSRGACGNVSSIEDDLPFPGEMNWTPSEQAFMVSSAFYGGAITILFSGSLADQYGPTRVLLAALGTSTFLTVLAPLIARTSYYLLLISRMIIGMGESFFVPGVNCLAVKWYPRSEKTTLAALYTSGIQLAAGFGSLFAAELCRSETLGGWPSIFYIFGAISVVFLILFVVFVDDTPFKSRWTSNKEKEYLREMLPPPGKKPTMLSAPWKAMLCSPPLHAVMTCSFAFGYSTAVVQAYLPMYLSEELGLPVETIGLYTLAPFIVQIIAKSICGPLTDISAHRGWTTLTNATKIAQSLGSFGASAMLICLAFVPSCDNPHIVLPILIVFGTVYAGGVCGYYTSLLMMSPLYTGTLSSFAQVFMMLAAICSSFLVTTLTSMELEHKWKFIFVSAAFFQALGGLHYLLVGSTEKQLWADVRRSRKTRSCEEF